MATLKDIQLKIVAVKKTQKITKAMNMVAASKLRGAQEKAEAFRPYANKFADVLGSLSDRIEADEEHAPPLLMPRKEVKTVDLLLMTSDRGLCGSFNTNLIAKAERFLKEKAEQGIDVRLICMGRKGRDYFRRRKENIIRENIGHRIFWLNDKISICIDDSPFFNTAPKGTDHNRCQTISKIK